MQHLRIILYFNVNEIKIINVFYRIYYNIEQLCEFRMSSATTRLTDHKSH